MNKLIIIIILNALTLNFALAQKPKRIIKTIANQQNECLMPLFEIQDASDLSDSLKNSKSIYESKLLLTRIKEHLEWFDIYKENCNCLKKLNDELFLFLPDDKIENALLLENFNEMINTSKQIASDFEFIWLLTADCY
jgi:hypothetical protein